GADQALGFGERGFESRLGRLGLGRLLGVFGLLFGGGVGVGVGVGAGVGLGLVHGLGLDGAERTGLDRRLSERDRFVAVIGEEGVVEVDVGRRARLGALRRSLFAVLSHRSRFDELASSRVGHAHSSADDADRRVAAGENVD